MSLYIGMLLKQQWKRGTMGLQRERGALEFMVYKENKGGHCIHYYKNIMGRSSSRTLKPFYVKIENF